MELYAGRGKTTDVIRKSGGAAAALDINYHVPNEGKQNYMDLSTPAGFALLGLDLKTKRQ